MNSAAAALDNSLRYRDVGRIIISSPIEKPAGALALKVLVILGFAAVYATLYLRGLDFGRPMREHSDEWAITEQAMQMADHGPLGPLHEYSYGSLSIFIQSGVCALLHAYNNAYGVYHDAQGHPIRRRLGEIAAEPRDRDQFPFYLAGRISVACYAGVLFCVVYLLGARLFASRPIACLCVLATMLNPLMVQQAHFALPNVLAPLLALAAVYCSLVFLDSGNKRMLYLGAVLAGLGVGTKLTMAIAFAPVAAAALVRLRTGSIKHLPFLLLAFAGSFLAVEPYIVFDARRFFLDIGAEVHTYGLGGVVDSRDLQLDAFGSATLRACADQCRLLYPVLYFIHQSPVCFVLAAIGTIALPFLAGQKGALLLVFPLLTLLLVGVQRKVLTTNYVPLIPFYALGLGATIYGLLKWQERRRRCPKPALLAGIVLLTILALAVPTRNGLGVVRQFTTRDPYQVAEAWLETNVPRNAKVSTECGLPAVFPFTNDGWDVKIEYFMFFWKPYTYFLDQDYVVVLTPGMYDRFAWFRPLIVFGKDNPAMREVFLRNRQLSEQRLMLACHVTPEECGYVPYAEMPIIAHDVSIYKVPKLNLIRVLGPKATDGDVRHWDVTLGHPMEARVQLAAGRYDVFLNASKNHMGPAVADSLAVRMDDQPACNVYVLDAGNYDHFVSTIDLDAPRDVTLHIALLAPTQTADQGMRINSIAFAPTTGPPIPGIPVPAAADHLPAS